MINFLKKYIVLRPVYAILVLTLPALFSQSTAEAATPIIKDTVSFSIHFKVGDSKLVETFKHNSETISNIEDKLNDLMSDNEYNLTKIVIKSAASPEGPLTLNEKLSKKRAEIVIAAIKEIDPTITDDMFEIYSLGEDWDSVLEFVLSSNISHKEETVNILANTPLRTSKNGKWSDERKDQMMNLDGGSVWNYLLKQYYPGLRKTDISMIFKTRRDYSDNILALSPVVENIHLDTPSKGLVFASPIPAPSFEEVSFPIALKTNLLFDAVTAVNASIEVPIGKKLSIEWQDIFPWWSAGPYNNKYALQLWCMGPELRWWFKRPDDNVFFNGQFTGINLMSGKYDFQVDKSLCLQGTFWSVGLSYGYSKPLLSWLNIELNASIGYVNINYQHYEPSENYDHLYRDKYRVGKVHYFGPTNLKISLSVPIEIKYNRRVR